MTRQADFVDAIWQGRSLGTAVGGADTGLPACLALLLLGRAIIGMSQ